MRYVLYINGEAHTESESWVYIQQVKKKLNTEGHKVELRVLSPNQES